MAIANYVRNEVWSFIPKEYVDISLPEREEGKYFDPDDAYLHWLADHLYETDIPLPDSQRLYLEKNSKLSFKEVLWTMSYELFKTHTFDNFEPDISFEKLNQMQLKCYEEGVKWAEENDEEPPSKEAYLFTQEEFDRIEYETLQCPDDKDYACDMPYRPIIAHFLKQIHDHDERYKMLKYFDDECEEQAWDYFK